MGKPYGIARGPLGKSIGKCRNPTETADAVRKTYRKTDDTLCGNHRESLGDPQEIRRVGFTQKHRKCRIPRETADTVQKTNKKTDKTSVGHP